MCTNSTAIIDGPFSKKIHGLRPCLKTFYPTTQYFTIPLHPQVSGTEWRLRKDAGCRGKVSKGQINQSVSILNTTNTEAVRTGEAVHVGKAAAKVQVAAVAAIDRTGPVAAVTACAAYQAAAVATVPRHNKL